MCDSHNLTKRKVVRGIFDRLVRNRTNIYTCFVRVVNSIYKWVTWHLPIRHLPRDIMGKCLSGQTLSGQMSFWANVIWSNVSGQKSLAKYRLCKCHWTIKMNLYHNGSFGQLDMNAIVSEFDKVCCHRFFNYTKQKFKNYKWIVLEFVPTQKLDFPCFSDQFPDPG
jgi:hypothetical protein